MFDPPPGLFLQGHRAVLSYATQGSKYATRCNATQSEASQAKHPTPSNSTFQATQCASNAMTIFAAAARSTSTSMMQGALPLRTGDKPNQLSSSILTPKLSSGQRISP